jgi:hypothetical protein
MLHLLNGDGTAAGFPDALPGERAVWRDILMEGPAGAGAAARAAWLAPRLGVTTQAYARGFREGEATLARAAAHDEVVLWFEQDLFCATNLWFVLDRLGDVRVSLVFPPLADGFRGLGALRSSDFPALFERRERLSDAARAEARALWRAYAAPDPTGLAALTPRGPFARRAIRLHCGRFPSAGQGLDEVEQSALAALDAPRPFAALFRAVTESPALRDLGMGDVQLAAALGDLATGPAPLVAIEARDQPLGRWRITRTAAGAEVLAGRADRLAHSPLDRWLGGVRLGAGAPLWRWDGAREALVAAGPYPAGLY